MARKGSRAKEGARPAVPFDMGRQDRLAEVLEALSYERRPPPPHACLLAVGEGVRVTLYESGKLLVQGKRADEVCEELAAFGLLSSDRLVSAVRGEVVQLEPAVGLDETGKGDYFGRLVVVACYVDEASWGPLAELGVRDSKRVGDRRAKELAREVRRLCPHEVVAVSPARYNEMYGSFGNLNLLLAWCHGRALEGLLTRIDCRRVVVDQFAKDPRVLRERLGERGLAADLTEMPRAESEPAVAAASIVARAAFLEDLGRLSEHYGIGLPKGASPAVEEAGRAFVARHGRKRLNEVAKLHFRTTDRVLGER
ncbi:ribonuclease HIII [Planctomycetota bacterium]